MNCLIILMAFIASFLTEIHSVVKIKVDKGIVDLSNVQINITEDLTFISLLDMNSNVLYFLNNDGRLKSHLNLETLDYEPPIELTKKRNIVGFHLLKNGNILFSDNNIGSFIEINQAGNIKNRILINNIIYGHTLIENEKLLVIEGDLSKKYLRLRDLTGKVLFSAEIDNQNIKNVNGGIVFQFNKYCFDYKENEVFIYSEISNTLYSFRHNNFKLDIVSRLSSDYQKTNRIIIDKNNQPLFFTNDSVLKLSEQKKINVIPLLKRNDFIGKNYICILHKREIIIYEKSNYLQ